MAKVFQFFNDCIKELKLVAWPERDNVFASVKVVIISTFAIAVVLGLLDFCFTEIFRFLMK